MTDSKRIMTRTVRLLRELVALPSGNPAFCGAGDERAGELQVGRLVAAVAARGGLDVVLEEVMPGRSNVLARLTPVGRVRRRVLLAPHLDTVDADDPGMFRPVVRGGRLYGRGATDTKGSVAVMLGALLEVAKGGRRPGETEVVFVGLVDEESQQAGSRALVRGGMRADLAVVGEPTRLKVVTAHKGNLWLRLETRGRAAHGSRPDLGRNAVVAMARIVGLLEGKYARQLERRRHVLLGHPTVNVGSIAGGRQPNIVPDHCWIEVDRRTLPGEGDARVMGEIRRLLAGAGVFARLSPIRGAPCRPLETALTVPLLGELMRAAGQRAGCGVDYFCDGAVLSAGGIPSVVFGPGDIAQAHTADEWVAVSQLEGAKAVLGRFLRLLP
jgi:acetylornithine deacetylase/succinyl-diaminopimelate desuccinylase-like protein